MLKYNKDLVNIIMNNVIIRCITGVLLAFCNSITDATTLSVDWMTLKKQPSYQYQQTYAGTISSKNQSKLGFELSQGELGSVEKVHVDVGQKFKKNDKLAQLDNRLIEQKIAQVKAQMNEVKANIKLAMLRVKRLTNLRKQNFSSVEALDEAKTRLESLKHQQDNLTHQLRALQIQLQKRSIIAPFDGIVIKRLLNHGDIIQGGNAALEVIDTGQYQINIGIPSAYLSYLKPGQTVNVSVDNQQFKGKISSISPNRNPTTQSHNVLITTKPKNIFIPHNALATINLPVIVKEKGSWVPITALQQSYRGLWNIYALTPRKNNLYQIEARPAKILYLGNEKAFISTSLTNKSKIVRSGLIKVVPGELVKLGQRNE